MKQNSSALSPEEQKLFIKVGDIKKYLYSKDKKTGERKKTTVFYTYGDVYYDIDGWADSKKFLPPDFELVLMRLRRERTISGWINGFSWEGLRLKEDDEVLFWKRKDEERG